MSRTPYPMLMATLALVLTACAPATPTATPSGPQDSPSPGSASSPASPPGSGVPPPPSTMLVVVYFGNTVLDPGTMECDRVYGVPRSVPASDDQLTAAMTALLAGPTSAEASQGYTSWFSRATADALIRARVSGDTSYVDLKDLRTVIPNASTSCGSAALIAQLDVTAQQAGMTPKVRYAFEGRPKVFWEWLQASCGTRNDNCDPTPFRT